MDCTLADVTRFQAREMAEKEEHGLPPPPPHEARDAHQYMQAEHAHAKLNFKQAVTRGLGRSGQNWIRCFLFS